jgi:hypothetical protein
MAERPATHSLDLVMDRVIADRDGLAWFAWSTGTLTSLGTGAGPADHRRTGHPDRCRVGGLHLA